MPNRLLVLLMIPPVLAFLVLISMTKLLKSAQRQRVSEQSSYDALEGLCDLV